MRNMHSRKSPMNVEISTQFAEQYFALSEGAGFVDFSDRTQLEFTGADRAKFLHNLCTNAMQNLPIGTGCEAFVLNVKGHIVGHVSIFAGPHSLVVETVPGQNEKLMAHFDRYLIREDVQIFDRSQEWAEVLLSGASGSHFEGANGRPKIYTSSSSIVAYRRHTCRYFTLVEKDGLDRRA